MPGFVSEGLVFPDLHALTAHDVLRELAERIAQRSPVESAAKLYERLEEREQLGSTGTGGGVAIPHCKLEKIKEVLIAVGLSEPIDFSASDGEPVRLFFVVVSPTANPAAHLKSLAAISKWVRVDRHVERLLACSTAEEMASLLVAERIAG